MPIYSAIKGTYPYVGGQGEAGFFGSRFNNQVTGGPAISLETGSIEGIGFFKQFARQDEAIRITSQFCEVKSCQVDTHIFAIRFSNDQFNNSPVFSYIHDCTFLHQDDPTQASLTVENGGLGFPASMGGALIENNNFNVSSAEGYTGVCAIKMDGNVPVSAKILNNVCQNFAAGAGTAALELYLDGGLVSGNNISNGISIGVGQTGIQLGNTKKTTVENNNISGFYYGIRLLGSDNAVKNCVIGPNNFSSNSVADILIDAGCVNNIIILTDPNTVVIDNSAPGSNLFIKSWLGASTAAPTTGTYARGDVIYNSTPSAGGFVGFVCVTAGTPGTWKTFGAISA
jgi:parallel beta-helix repeat protein